MRHLVILAGGSGTRLWPASRKDRPKQFLRLVGAETLLQATVRRARAISGGRVLVVTAQAQAALVQADSPTVEIVAEPLGRNTAIAIGLAATLLAADDPEAILGVLPADQHITDEAGLAAVIGRAFAAAERADVICTVGV
nr:NTP transferase domain-containing protein [Kofleriaceae bacterium]